MAGWMKHNLESRLQGEININNLKYADDTTLMAEREEEIKRFFKVKKESDEAGLKLNTQKTKIMTSGPTTSCEKDEGKDGNYGRFYFLGLQNHCIW